MPDPSSLSNLPNHGFFLVQPIYTKETLYDDPNDTSRDTDPTIQDEITVIQDELTTLTSNLQGNSFLYTQSVPSNVWTINHTLNKRPSVTILDSSFEQIYADVSYPSTSQVIINLSAAVSGTAYLI